MNVSGTMTEVAALQKALSEAEDNAAKERIEREKQEARVGEVQQELQALVKKHEALGLESKNARVGACRGPRERKQCQGRSPKGPPGD